MRETVFGAQKNDLDTQRNDLDAVTSAFLTPDRARLAMISGSVHGDRCISVADQCTFQRGWTSSRGDSSMFARDER
jgi:hypothetical protein